MSNGTRRSDSSVRAWLALACLAFSGCVYTTRFSFSALEAIPAGAKGVRIEGNIAILKLERLRLLIFTWDAVAPRERAPNLVLMIALDPGDPGFSFDPTRMALDVPGRGVVPLRDYEGPGKHVYGGFGVDGCGAAPAARAPSGPIPLIRKGSCFVLTFDAVVAGEPVELHLDGIARNGRPISVPRLRLSRREGRGVTSVPTPGHNLTVR